MKKSFKEPNMVMFDFSDEIARLTSGDDGVSVTEATIDDNGDLILTLSNGRTINVGKVKESDDGTDGDVGG